MTTRKAAPYLLRAVAVNALIAIGFVQAQHTGRMTNSLLAIYLFMAVAANALMFFGARARRRMAGKTGR